ncbi:MAG: Trm112 family protein [Woeseiaceae bacterium]|jgi:uncharacterized protein YbaR (Trm112 family)|nr:Trm112 family protein [Woeseiaceae bacterium]
MRKKILNILCCPVTRQPLSKVTEKKLTALNEAIENGSITNHEKKSIKKKLLDALITKDGLLLYPIEEGIPVLLENRSISLDQLD